MELVSSYHNMGVSNFPTIGVPQKGWFVMEKPIEMDDWGVTTIFGKTPLCLSFTHLLQVYMYIYIYTQFLGANRSK